MIPVPLNLMVPSTYLKTLFTDPVELYGSQTWLIDTNGKLWGMASGNTTIKVFDAGGNVLRTFNTMDCGGAGSADQRVSTFGEWFYFCAYQYDPSGSGCTMRMRLYGYRPRDNHLVEVRLLSATNGIDLVLPVAGLSADISIDPTSKRGVYTMGSSMMAFLYGGRFMQESGWFSVPVWGDAADPAYISNGYTENVSGAGPTWWQSYVSAGANPSSQAMVSYMANSATWYYRKITDLLAPSLVTVWSGTGGTTRVNFHGAGFMSREIAPGTLYNFDGSLSWATGLTPLYLKTPLQLFGEDGTYYYVGLIVTGYLKFLSLAKAGTTFSVMESIPNTWGSLWAYPPSDKMWPGPYWLKFPPIQFYPVADTTVGVVRSLNVPLAEIS